MRIGEPGLEIYLRNAALPRRRVEKANPSSQLTERDKDTAQPRMVIATARNVSDVSRRETAELAMSPILGQECGFMAQIIGQVLTSKRVDSNYVARAYSVNCAAPNATSRLVDSI